MYIVCHVGGNNAQIVHFRRLWICLENDVNF